MWLSMLRFFDQIRFYPVSAEELLQIRRDFPLGRFELSIEDSELALADYQQFLHSEAEGIAAFRGQQRAAFAAQLELARRLGCPLVVHSRGAFAECVEMIDEAGIDWARVVFHCFTENEAEMRELMRRGALGSFTGVLTYKSAGNVRDAARLQGLSRFMLETDAPYLTPMPHRGKPNEPAYLRHTAEFAAGVFGVPYEELAARSTANARAFYAAFSWVPGGFKNFFAVKALPNPHILAALKEEGFGGDCSSLAELRLTRLKDSNSSVAGRKRSNSRTVENGLLTMIRSVF
jgi:TatD DNase family protein